MKRDPFKTGAYALLTILIVILTIRECSRPPKPLPPTVRANEDSILVKNDRVASLDKAGQAIVRKMAQDSIRHFEALKRSESRVEGLTKSLAAAVRKAPLVMHDTVFLIMDSIIVEKSTEIALLKQDRDSLRTNYAGLLRIKDTELRIKDEMFSHMESINSELYRTLNKERRRGKFLKIAVPVVFVGGFLIGSEL